VVPAVFVQGVHPPGFRERIEPFPAVGWNEDGSRREELPKKNYNGNLQ
jgi:hypothetical protein